MSSPHDHFGINRKFIFVLEIQPTHTDTHPPAQYLFLLWAFYNYVYSFLQNHAKVQMGFGELERANMGYGDSQPNAITRYLLFEFQKSDLSRTITWVG